MSPDHDMLQLLLIIIWSQILPLPQLMNFDIWILFNNAS